MTRLAFETTSKIRRMVYISCFVIPDGKQPITLIDARVKSPIDFVCRGSIAPVPNHPAGAARLEVFAIAAGEFELDTIVLEVELKVGEEFEALSYDHAAIERSFLFGPYTTMQTWKRVIADDGIRMMLDIGGRARSGVSRKHDYPGKTVVVADIVSAPDVDIVVDVHELSQHVEEKFDAFTSIAVFEHLLMPWKAAVEINKVLKPGAVGLVVTHQTVGVHEVPWDFFRYSNNAWKGIFNQYSGFEILDAGMTTPTMIIPLRWQKQYQNTERAVGYMTSSVVVKKVSEPSLDWPVPIASVTGDMYPH
jgi:SAM-dependent methyltransferase